jgi:hypothetical protein
MKYLKFAVTVFTVFVVAVAFFACKKTGETRTVESGTAGAAVETVEMTAAEPVRGEDFYGYKDFYLGMPESEFRTAFGGRAKDGGEGRYIYAEYPCEDVGLTFSDLSGGSYLTSINVRFAEREDEESILAGLMSTYGEPEYDSYWVPANTDCNDSSTPVRNVLWPGMVDISLLMSASRDFDETSKKGVKFRGELWVEDGRGRSDPHPWVNGKLEEGK